MTYDSWKARNPYDEQGDEYSWGDAWGEIEWDWVEELEDSVPRTLDDIEMEDEDGYAAGQVDLPPGGGLRLRDGEESDD